MERCPAEGKGWDGKPTKDFHLPVSCCSHSVTCMNFLGLCTRSVQSCAPRRKEGGREAVCSYPGGCVCAECSAEGTRCPSLAWPWRCGRNSEVQPCPGMALPMPSSSTGPGLPSLPAQKMQLLLHIGRGKTMTLLISVCGSHLPKCPWALISISVSYPRPV